MLYVLVVWDLWYGNVLDQKSGGVREEGACQVQHKTVGVLVQLRESEVLCTVVMHPFHLYLSILPCMESLTGN